MYVNLIQWNKSNFWGFFKLVCSLTACKTILKLIQTNRTIADKISKSYTADFYAYNILKNHDPNLISVDVEFIFLKLTVFCLNNFLIS